jgi:hypothetical protein
MLKNFKGSLKIKERVLKNLISGVTCPYPRLLIDIISRHF